METVLSARLIYGQTLSRRRDWETLKDYSETTTMLYPGSKDAWHQLILALRLLERDEQANAAAAEARACCADWSQIDDGDVWRDAALALIRPLQGEGARAEPLDRAGGLLEQARAAHKGNPNRRAAVFMAKGRLFEARGIYHEAGTHYYEANRTWRVLASRGGDADEQWRFNLLPHWQRLANRRRQYLLALWLGLRTLWRVRRYGKIKHAALALIQMLPGGWRKGYKV